MGVTVVYRKIEKKFFLENGLTDYNGKKVCYRIEAGDALKKS